MFLELERPCLLRSWVLDWSSWILGHRTEKCQNLMTGIFGALGLKLGQSCVHDFDFSSLYHFSLELAKYRLFLYN
jgi:hypothetical protein